jgi:hypothetical protein
MYVDDEKVKGHLMICLCKHKREVEVKILPIRNPALEGGGWSAPRSGHFNPGKTRYHSTGG